MRLEHILTRRISMVRRWGGQTWYNEYDIRRTFGISLETLMRWIISEPITTVRMHGDTYYEEQSLRACIARHQGGRGG